MPSTTRPPAERERVLADLIQVLERELIPLHVAYNQAAWRMNVTGEARDEQECERLKLAIHAVLARDDPYRTLEDLAASGGVGDPLLARQLTLLLHEHRAHRIPAALHQRIVKLETGLESTFNHFRASLDGQRVSDNTMREILRESDDSGRRRVAWEASKQIGREVATDLKALVRLRNEAAHTLGYSNYYSMMLTLDELDEAELFVLLDRVDQGTRPLWQAYTGELNARLAARFGCDVAALRPWHHGDPFFQEAPTPAGVNLDPYFEGKALEDITERFFRAVGFEIGDLLARADLYEKPGKSQHAFCMSVDRGQDIRVLCNLRSNEYWMGTMLHEYGHAVYDQCVDPALPYFLRTYAHLLSTEASAMLFGRLSKNAAWLIAYAGAPAGEANAKASALASATRAQLLVQTRWELVMCHMERALYRDPEQDLDRLWWDLVERYQWVTRPDRRHEPDWASKIHFSVAPIYYHNYLMGEIMASQLQAHLFRQVLGGGEDVWERYVASPKVGEFLTQRLYRSGRRFDWRGTLERAIGQPLDPTEFVNDLAGRA